MELFCKVMFWGSLALAAMTWFVIGATKEYPYQQKKTLGAALMDLVVYIAVAVWSGIVLWWR